MKKLLLIFTLGAIVLFVSCDDDEPKIDPIVGLWELDDAIISDAPSNFSNVEGSGPNIYGEDTYTIEFFQDGLYEREIDFPAGSFFSDIDEEGEWEVNGDELELDPDRSQISGLDYSFSLEEDISDREMLISSLSEVLAFTDQFVADFNATQDTITSQEVFDSILNANVQEIQVKVTLEFDRQ